MRRKVERERGLGKGGERNKEKNEHKERKTRITRRRKRRMISGMRRRIGRRRRS
jgi:hypothetical protein